jgi:hypothetical protein
VTRRPEVTPGADGMSTRTLWLAHVISQNVFPLAGVLLLGWDAKNVLLLYFVDTVLAMAVIFAGLAGAFLPAHRAADRRKFAHGAGLIVPVMIVIVAVTLPFVLGRDFNWQAAADDGQLRAGMLWQAIAALWSCRDLIRALRESTPEKLRLERRFGLVLSRWLTLVLLAVVVVSDRFGQYGSVVLVAAYIVLSIWIEVAPQHFLAGMPHEDETLDGNPASPPRRSTTQRSKRKR